MPTQPRTSSVATGGSTAPIGQRSPRLSPTLAGLPFVRFKWALLDSRENDNDADTSRLAWLADLSGLAHLLNEPIVTAIEPLRYGCGAVSQLQAHHFQWCPALHGQSTHGVTNAVQAGGYVDAVANLHASEMVSQRVASPWLAAIVQENMAAGLNAQADQEFDSFLDKGYSLGLSGFSSSLVALYRPYAAHEIELIPSRLAKFAQAAPGEPQKAQGQLEWLIREALDRRQGDVWHARPRFGIGVIDLAERIVSNTPPLGRPIETGIDLIGDGLARCGAFPRRFGFDPIGEKVWSAFVYGPVAVQSGKQSKALASLMERFRAVQSSCNAVREVSLNDFSNEHTGPPLETLG